jgi:hypothetical protein
LESKNFEESPTKSLRSTLHHSTQPLSSIVSEVLTNRDIAKQTLKSTPKQSQSFSEIDLVQAKSTAKLRVSIESDFPREWNQSLYDDQGLKVELVRKIAEIQEHYFAKEKALSPYTGTKVGWGAPLVTDEAIRVGKVRSIALNTEKTITKSQKQAPNERASSVTYDKKAKFIPLEQLKNPLKSSKPMNRANKPGKENSRKSSPAKPKPVSNEPKIEDNPNLTLEEKENLLKQKLETKIRALGSLSSLKRKARISDLKEKYDKKIQKIRADAVVVEVPPPKPPVDHSKRHLEQVRYTMALKALVRDKMKEKFTEDIPAICTCGALNSKKNLGKMVQCANNCPFYNRQQEYQKAVAEMLASFQASQY